MSVSTRWPLVVPLPVLAGERDDDGVLTVPGIERLFTEARTAYFEQCSTVDAATVEVQRGTADPGRAAVDDEGVTVAVAVVEVYPDSFTMTARLRPRGPSDGDGIAATAWCELSPGGAVTTAMRDEFIAHAHGARHFH
jgi:hypothetical protein